MFFFSGDAGAGKSTAALELAEQRVAVGFPRPVYLSTGDALRERSVLEPGASFGPDELVARLVVEALQRGDREGVDVVVDGYPRKPHQVQEGFALVFVHAPRHQPSVEWLTISVEEALRRYKERGYRLSPRSGKIGPAGQRCPAGGEYSDDPTGVFRARREAHEPFLRETLEKLREFYPPRVKEWNK